MSSTSAISALSHLLPEAHVGKVSAVESIALGSSGAAVYAVSCSRGELVLRVHSATDEPARWQQQLRISRLAAESGVAPVIVHVDDAARAIVSERIAAPIAAALGDPTQRDAAISSVVGQLRALHRLDATQLEQRDPLAYARRQYVVQRLRPGFPVWASQLDEVFDAIESVLVRDPRRVVSHNDMNPRNIMWDGKRAWLIDWEVAGLTHPFFDLAVLAMFIQLPEPAAQQLLALQEQRTLDASEHATFAALRRLAALMFGCLITSKMPDLAVLPEPPKTLTQVYGALRAGDLDVQSPRGQAAFATALLRLGAVPV
jgi:aminoglycoside phosphotransferase (APT) family kinase protein